MIRSSVNLGGFIFFTKISDFRIEFYIHSYERK